MYIDKLQEDLINVGNWSEEWLMLSNIDQCKVMHIGYNNKKAEYETDGRNLKEVLEERDLGIIMQFDLKCSSHCSKAVKTANRILGMIKRTFTYVNKEIKAVIKIFS